MYRTLPPTETRASTLSRGGAAIVGGIFHVIGDRGRAGMLDVCSPSSCGGSLAGDRALQGLVLGIRRRRRQILRHGIHHPHNHHGIVGRETGSLNPMVREDAFGPASGPRSRWRKPPRDGGHG